MQRGSLALIVFAFGLSVCARADEPSIVPLWEKGAPGFEERKDEQEKRNVQKSGEYNVTNVHNPYVTVFLPSREKATGAAVIIAPGGGHR
ncbi:MAG TPA: hypothetical protein VG099_03320, partial [Gemmataceae bacterium]|nr:hypothetical protein [Gemmataceae bacterium]